MEPNPVLKKLGLKPDDRVVILHADDIGMCQSSVSAFEELNQFGLISSGAVMVPCPWFLQAAEFQKIHPSADMGVHATLTSEWSTYRWGPISTRDPASGLMDEQGYFHRRSAEVHENAVEKYVAVELELQIQRALTAGMTPTHMDTHMGSIAHPRFMQSYVDLAVKYRVPPMVFRMDERGYQATGMDPFVARQVASYVRQLEHDGMPLLDRIHGMPLNKPEDRLEQTKAALASLEPGITHFIIHPSKDTPELRAITPDWRSRVADFQTFLSDELRTFIENQGLIVIGYRGIQNLMP